MASPFGRPAPASLQIGPEPSPHPHDPQQPRAFAKIGRAAPREFKALRRACHCGQSILRPLSQGSHRPGARRSLFFAGRRRPTWPPIAPVALIGIKARRPTWPPIAPVALIEIKARRLHPPQKCAVRKRTFGSASWPPRRPAEMPAHSIPSWGRPDRFFQRSGPFCAQSSAPGLRVCPQTPPSTGRWPPRGHEGRMAKRARTTGEAR